MNLLTFAMFSALVLPGQAANQTPAAASSQAIAPAVDNSVAPNPASSLDPAPALPVAESTPIDGILDRQPERRMFESDRAFENFIGPTTNPVLAKDPRSNTYARLLFINNEIPGSSALGGGNFQAYAMQVNVALTERLTLIADKDGVASIHPGAGASTTGFLDLAGGLKYTFWRDVENQALGAAGFLYEAPSGEANVYQHQGNGVFTVFLTGGKQFCEYWHAVGTLGYQFGVQQQDNSSFLYKTFHIDRQFFGWFYPLAEVNIFHYLTGGNHGLPSGLGEGDGLLNLGATGVSGNTLVTGAVGAKAILSSNAQLGVAWEFPLTGEHELINNRLTVEFILRY